MNDLKTGLADADKVSGRVEATQKPRRRRRASYSLGVAVQICVRLMMGESLRQICQDPNMPARSSVFLWLRRHEDFRYQYRSAKQVQIDALLDELGGIVYDSSDDWVDRVGENGQIRRAPNYDNIRRAKLRIAACKWHIAKLMPKKYEP